jgi:hypothetical protein
MILIIMTESNNQSIELVQKKLDEVTNVMQENIQIAFKNTDKIENLEEKTEILKDSAEQFNKKSRQIKAKLICQYYGKYIGITIFVILLIVLFVYIFSN